MPTDVIMPQMGESIFEGTITKWLKKPGEKVQRDEPLFEISTDKVDAEIPAPTSGVLEEIKVPEGTTVQVNTVVGSISADGGGAKAAPAKTEAGPSAAVASGSALQEPRAGESQEPRGGASASHEESRTGASAPQSAPQAEFAQEPEDVRSSPLVRRIAKENNVDLAQVQGTGNGGRVTKQDILNFLEKGGGQQTRPAATSAASPGAPSFAASAPAPATPSRPAVPAAIPGETVAMTQMRK